MTFLAAIASKVLISLLSGIGGWLIRHFQEMWKDYQAKKVDEQKTADVVKAVQDAKTREDLDSAAKGISDDV